MPDFTKNLRLEKPLEEEFYNIEVQNRNMDKIDTAISAKGDKQKIFTAKLLASGWSDTAPYKQTAAVTGMKANYLAKCSLQDNSNAEEYAAFSERSDFDTKEGGVEGIFYEVKPTVDLHIRLVVDF